MTRRAFSLVELLVVLAVVALLLALLLPGLGAAVSRARALACASSLKQLGVAWNLYAADFADRALPCAYWEAKDIGLGPQVFWWGSHGTSTEPPDFSRGFIAPYFDAPLHERSPLECPDQPWGSYLPQGPSQAPTSTYGYNGYFLSPAKTPGWGSGIAHRPWQRLADLARPSELLVFADAMLALDPQGLKVKNSALLDPPMLHSSGSGWTPNPFPTTAFRHARGRRAAGEAAALLGDAAVRSLNARADWLVQPWIGSVGSTPGPWHVPDWNLW